MIKGVLFADYYIDFLKTIELVTKIEMLDITRKHIENCIRQCDNFAFKVILKKQLDELELLQQRAKIELQNYSYILN